MHPIAVLNVMTRHEETTQRITSMSTLDDNLAEFQQFPEPLRMLVEAELRAGNEIIDFGHGFPAAPCGAYIKLARPVRTRERIATVELDFYDRNSSNYSGEFTDANRHFFVLEPPHPPEQPPDMQALRAAIDAEYAANEALQTRGVIPVVPVADTPRSNADPTSIAARFAKSMEMTYDKWREGEGYDLTLIADADKSTRDAIETLILRQSPLDWRGIEALALLDSPKARNAIMTAFSKSDAKTRLAVHRYAPQLLSEEQRTDSILRALRESEIYTGLSETLDEIEDFHPPAIVQELLRGLMKRDGATACHFAAMLYFLHGKAASAFDWDHRPFFLRFNTEDLVEREIAVHELCNSIGVDPSMYLSNSVD